MRRWISRLTNGFAYALAAAIIIASLTVGYLLLAPADVITDWKLKVSGNSYALGDTVVIESSYRKLREVTGTSKRYIECQNQNHVYIRYPLNEAEANRQAGRGGTGVIVKIPTEIPEVTLPTKCHFNIVIEYDVYSFRTVTEKNQSKDFTLTRPAQ